MDIDSGDMGGGEIRQFFRSYTGYLETELAQFTEIHLFAFGKGFQQIVSVAVRTATTSARLTVVCEETRLLSCFKVSSPLICEVA